MKQRKEEGGPVSKATVWTRVYKNIDVDVMSLANEIAEILQKIGLSAAIKEKGFLKKTVLVNFSKGGMLSWVRGHLEFSGGPKKFTVQMSFSHFRSGDIVDMLRELWQNMDTLVQKHGIKVRGLPIEIEAQKPTTAPTQPTVAQAPPQAPAQPVQQVSVVVPVATPTAPAQPAQPQQPQQVTVKTCPYCGATITQADAKFCPKCGASLQ